MGYLFMGYGVIKLKIKNMFNSVKNIRANKLEGIFNSAFLLELLITLVAGIVGIIVYHINGGYQGASFFENIKEMSFDRALEASFDSDAFSFMTEGILIYVIGGLCAVEILMAVFAAIAEHPIYMTGAIGSLVGFAYSVTVYGEQSAFTVISGLAFFILFAISILGNRGGKLFVMAILGLVNHMLLMPKFMLICQNPLNAVQVVGQVVIYLVVAAIVLPLVLGGVVSISSHKSGSSSGTESTVSSVDSSRNEKRDELIREIAELERKNDYQKKCIDGRNSGSLNYAHIDVKGCQGDISRRNREIESRKRKLEKMG